MSTVYILSQVTMTEVTIDFGALGISPAGEKIFSTEIGSKTETTYTYGRRERTIIDRSHTPTRIVVLSHSLFFLPNAERAYGEGVEGTDCRYSVNFVDQSLGSIAWGGLTEDQAREIFEIATNEGPLKAEERRQQLLSSD